GPGSECSLNGLYLNDGNRLIDNALYVDHDAPNCRSRMGYKGVLAGESSAVFTGKVYVHRHAQKTDSNQLNNNLLLSDTAVIDTKPQLEIFADDVKCTHGATIGGFPREQLFYFQSRGIGAEKAHGILTYGFASEVAGQIEIAPLRDWLNKLVYDKYANPTAVIPAKAGIQT
ncbi:MAG: SufD family Fe-S cluster assembly protein, partial [Candidatus Hydrogenedentota bacterium]